MLSPSGYKVYREKDRFFAFFWEKESLLALAETAGVEALTETIGMGAENTSDGVKVCVRGKSGKGPWRRRRQLYERFYDEELSKLEQELKKTVKETVEETIEERVQRELRERWR